MVVVYGVNNKWRDYVLVSIKSLVTNNDVSKIYLLVEDFIDTSMFSSIDIEQIRYVDALSTYINSTNKNTFFSEACMVRLLLPKLLKEDKVLWLDSDTIVDGNIEGLWNIDLSNYYIAGYPDSGMDSYSGYSREGESLDLYINSGVLLMNLSLIRECSVDDEMLRLINSYEYLYPDQDVINVSCRDKIYPISIIYNYFDFNRNIDNIVIYHWAAQDKSSWVYSLPFGDKWIKYKEMLYE